MPVNLDGLTVLMVGGDQRELILMQSLTGCGARVVAAGFLNLPAHPLIEAVRDLPHALAKAHAVIAPMSSTDVHGRITAVSDPTMELVLDSDFFSRMRRDAPFFIGIARPVIRSLCREAGIRVIEMAEVDEIATLNSIPTAEGAIQRAMEELQITIHGSQAAVIGFGRCGVTLTRMLLGLGARTTVIARNPAQLARAYEMGACIAPWEQAEVVLARAQVIFNTVPAPVLSRSILERLDRGCLIIDIASAPGGTDFEAARALGIRAYLELGLPGKVAPQTAGEILGRCIPPMIRDLCT